MPAREEALSKSVTVQREPWAAFEAFTDRLGDWWPLATHSVGRDAAGDVILERGVGGRLVETLADGSAAVWGTVTAWDPPRRVEFTWHPGTPEAEATLVEVTFQGIGAGTEVRLVHSGWGRRGDGDQARDAYDAGWDIVLGGYVGLVG